MPAAPTIVSAAPQQIGDGNTQGSFLFPATDSAGNPAKGAFFGGTPVVQPLGNSLAALARGQQAGVVTTYASTQSPIGGGVSANTTAESAALTVQTGTGFTMQLATTDLPYVNKPTAQAGLGYGNVRISAANSLRITFSNFTAGSLTPTGSEVYSIVAIRGLPTISVTLSPPAVPATSTQEFQFTIPASAISTAGVGVSVGMLVQVVKPTSQAGLDVYNPRVVSNNVVSITFANFTGAPITPTAAEVYTVFAIAGLDAINNDMFYGFNVGTVGAIGAGVVVTGGNTTLTGVLATDMLVGVMKPTLQAAATNAAIVDISGTVLTANTLTLGFFGVGTGYTPTASEVYGIHTKRINPAAPLLLYNQVLTPVSVAANTTAEQTFTVTGLISGTPVFINKPSYTNGLVVCGVRISGTNTLAITYGNITGTAIVPPSESYIIGNFQALSPGAGNCVYQSVAAAYQRIGDLVAALRNALGPSAVGGVNLHAGG